jgi:putative Mg2+ transporter-C (MgtC) family protein
MDMMRLPLGILSGVGFIGAGAILRRGNMVTGVTTAATLWFVTVLGLCFGGGQIWLGSAALALGMVVLWALRVAERFFNEEHDAVFILDIDGSGPSDDELRTQLKLAGLKIRSYGLTTFGDRTHRRVRMEVRWKARVGDPAPPAVVHDLQQRSEVLYLNWRP